MERISLSEGSYEDHLQVALKGIKDGYVICAPLEHAYVYLADAFFPDAVRAMNVLRGANLGVAAQVLIHSADTITGLSRGAAVGIIFLAVIAFVALFIAIIVPPLVSQTSHLIESAPTLLQDLKNNSLLADLNDKYGIIDTLQKKIEGATSDGTLIVTAFGGVIGVGKTVISGAFTGLTILVLTLYFLISLPTATTLALKMVPASRRDRITLLTDAIIGRVGAFVGTQLTVSFLAGVVISIASLALGLPSPIAIGILVFICGLIPLVGHFIGSAVVTLIALTQSLTAAIAILVIYVIYQQVENYVITPRMMKRSLSLPGAVTIVAALIGTSLLGLVGGLLAVPVAASIILILEEVVYPRADLN